jgi:two-component sensor histidine kinase
VDFADYTRSLTNYLARAHGGGVARVTLKLELEPVLLPVESAVHCGLILSELVTNAYKHAFSGRTAGEVSIGLHRSPDALICLRISDNGVGLPLGMDWRQSRSLGLRLIHLLTGQLKAAVEVRNSGGTDFRISFRQPQPDQST